MVTYAQPALGRQAFLVAVDGALVGLVGVFFKFLFGEGSREPDHAVDEVEQDLQGSIGRRPGLHHRVEDVPVFGVMLAVAFVMLVAVGVQQAVIVGADSQLKAVPAQAERAELVELHPRRVGEVNVVDEVDHPAGSVGVKRGGIAFHHLYPANGVEIDGLDACLPVGFRLGDVVEKDAYPPDPGVRPAAKTPDRDPHIMVAVTRLKEHAGNGREHIVHPDLPVVPVLQVVDAYHGVGDVDDPLRHPGAGDDHLIELIHEGVVRDIVDDGIGLLNFLGGKMIYGPQEKQRQ